MPILIIQVREPMTMMMRAGNRKAVVRSGWILDILKIQSTDILETEYGGQERERRQEQLF